MRRAEITAAALDIIAESGLCKVSHRKIAGRAGVALGTTTYYYPSLRDLVLQAMTAAVEEWATDFENRLADREPAASVQNVLVDAAAEFVEQSTIAVVTCELYVHGARDDALRELTNTWLQRVRNAVATVADPVRARAIVALLDGAMFQAVILGEPFDRQSVGPAIACLLAD
ncbi:hypothetical protein A5643_12825 [Mycobacterium sp. 1274756.6]|nr:hypothetical protein A5643_12825 [Mycobacterium sp. 1274756.6]